MPASIPRNHCTFVCRVQGSSARSDTMTVRIDLRLFLRIVPVLVLMWFGTTNYSTGQVSKPQPSPPYWTAEQSDAILNKTASLRMNPDLSTLTKGEMQAMQKLLEVGAIFQSLYEAQRHRQALESFQQLQAMDRKTGSSHGTQNLLTLYRLFQGPVATTLDNKRVAFLDTDPEMPGRNVYPWGITKQEIDDYLNSNPSLRSSILNPRTVVRRSDRANVDRDLAVLSKYPVLDTLHPGLRAHLQAVRDASGTKGLYAVPMSVAYADQMISAYFLLDEAASAVEPDDEAFSRYLRNRGRDLLSDDYESGDAAWVTSTFGRLNAQIGAYETYDDELYNTKTFYGLSVLLRDVPATSFLQSAVKDLQELEDSLPGENHKTVESHLSIGVYNVIAEFGQARGSNIATELPNEPDFARRYGRTVLIRANILRDPVVFKNSSDVWRAAVDPVFRDDLTPDGELYRLLWHEIGHKLGVDQDKSGRSFEVALEDTANVLSELRADLVSLYLGDILAKKGLYTEQQLRSVYCYGIRWTLPTVRPRREDPYQTMQLMQLNYYLEKGLLHYEPSKGIVSIDYTRMHEVVGMLLKDVSKLLYDGDPSAARAYINRYTTWDPGLHDVLSQRIRAERTIRYALVKYAALGE